MISPRSYERLDCARSVLFPQILGTSDCFAFFSHPEKIGKKRDYSLTSRSLFTDNIEFSDISSWSALGKPVIC